MLGSILAVILLVAQSAPTESITVILATDGVRTEQNPWAGTKARRMTVKQAEALQEKLRAKAVLTDDESRLHVSLGLALGTFYAVRQCRENQAAHGSNLSNTTCLPLPK